MSRNQESQRWFVVESTDRKRLNAMKRHFQSEQMYRAITSRRAMELASDGERPEMVLIDFRYSSELQGDFVRAMRQRFGGDETVPIVLSFRTPGSGSARREPSGLRAAPG